MNEKKLPPVDSFFLDIDQQENIRRMSALGYDPEDIAIYLRLDPNAFIKDAFLPGTNVNLLIKEGILITRAKPDIELHKLAEKGNLTAIQQLEKTSQRIVSSRIIKQLDEDELG